MYEQLDENTNFPRHDPHSTTARCRLTILERLGSVNSREGGRSPAAAAAAEDRETKRSGAT